MDLLGSSNVVDALIVHSSTPVIRKEELVILIHQLHYIHYKLRPYTCETEKGMAIWPSPYS